MEEIYKKFRKRKEDETKVDYIKAIIKFLRKDDFAVFHGKLNRALKPYYSSNRKWALACQQITGNEKEYINALKKLI